MVSGLFISTRALFFRSIVNDASVTFPILKQVFVFNFFVFIGKFASGKLFHYRRIR